MLCGWDRHAIKNDRNDWLECDELVIDPDADIRLYSMWRDCPAGANSDPPTFGRSGNLDPFDDGLRDGARINLDTAGFDMVTFHVDSICRIIGEQVAADRYWQIDRFAIHRVPDGVETLHLDIFRY